RRARSRLYARSRRPGHGRAARRLRGGIGVGHAARRRRGHVALPSPMSAHRRIFHSALVIVLAMTTAEATVGASPTSSLAARAARFPRVATATADFVQEREVSLVEDVLHARGMLTLAAPTSFRLDLTAPEPMTLVAAGATTIVVDASGKVMPVPAEYAGLAG